MSDPNSRLTIAEMRLAQHDKLHEETQSNLRTLSEGITKLVEAEIRRETDSATFERIFAAIKSIERELEDFKNSVAEKELAAYKGVVWKLVGLSALIVASVVAGHFGVHLLG